jgi:hypothetical protein
MLLHGLASLCLALSLTSCAGNKPENVRTETVEVAVPVIVDVPDALTAQEREPQLPAGDLVGEDLAEFIETLRAWGRTGWCRVELIGNLGPRDDVTTVCDRMRKPQPAGGQ